jgi:hypothetical protein
MKDGHVYFITFEDTIKTGAADTLTTKNYTLFDSTANVTLIDKATNFKTTDEGTIVDGFKLSFVNSKKVALDTTTSGWNRSDITRFVLAKYSPPQTTATKGKEKPNDYRIIIGNVGIDTSTSFTYSNITFPAKPVNFRLFNVSENKFIDFGFIELDTAGTGSGVFSSNGSLNPDIIVFLETTNDTGLAPTWQFSLARVGVANIKNPVAGDSAIINIIKPFLSSDVFRFVANSAYTDNELAKMELDNIKVVPNPYLASAKWEPKNPYSSGRGPRSIHFTHLPSKCTIRIFTVNGELVKEIEHESTLNDGSAEWDLLTRDNLSASYGIYIYHVEAPGVGTKAGKFAIIK